MRALRQEDYARITDLVWDPEALRRDAACVFVSRFILQEDGQWYLRFETIKESLLNP